MIQGNYSSKELYGQYTGNTTARQKQPSSTSFLDLAAQFSNRIRLIQKLWKPGRCFHRNGTTNHKTTGMG